MLILPFSGLSVAHLLQKGFQRPYKDTHEEGYEDARSGASRGLVDSGQFNPITWRTTICSPLARSTSTPSHRKERVGGPREPEHVAVRAPLPHRGNVYGDRKARQVPGLRGVRSREGGRGGGDAGTEGGGALQRKVGA